MQITPSKTGVPFLFYLANVSVAFGHEPEPNLPFERPHSHEAVEGHAHLGWESRYFSEGRDNLDGDSLLFGSFEMGWKHLTAGIWYGSSPDQRYDEVQLTLGISEQFGDFEIYGGYTHLQFPFDGSYDNEIGGGIVWSGLPVDLECSADVYYSFDADGYFVELAMGRNFVIHDELKLNLSLPFGINQGYVADGHDGVNHIAVQLGLEWALSETLSISAHSTYSLALEKDSALPGDDSLRDFFHAGVGLQWSF